jgi:tetratricopeptide (TPR) repeat protein
MAAKSFISSIRALIDAGQFQDALKKLKPFIDDHPDDAECLSYLGVAQNGIGLGVQANDTFKQAYNLEPSFYTLQNLVQSMIRHGHDDEALAVLKDAPKAVTSHRSFGPFYMICTERLGTLDDAIAFGTSAVEQDPMNQEMQAELARLMMAARDYQAAAVLLEKLTAQEEASPALLINFGTVLGRLDRDDEATAVFAKAIEREPENPQFINALAKHHRKLGHFDAAEADFVRALALDASSAQIHSDLGSFYLSRGRFLEAADCFREMTRLVPDHAKAHQQLGQALHRLKRYDSAVSAFETALRCDPNHAPSYNSMGVMLKKIGHVEEAIQSYRSAIKADPNMKEAYNNLANALRDNNLFGEAAKTVEQALAVWPDYGDLYNTRGVIEQQSGKKDQAVASYRRAIELNPKLSKAFHNLTSAKKVTADDPIVPLIKARAVDPSFSEHDRINYNFALGKALADLKCYPESYAAIERGNLMRKKELGYDIAQDRFVFESIKKAFSTPSLIAKKAHPLRGGKRPIFILGMSRSGTSLTEQIVSAHPDVYGCGELEFLHQELKKMSWLDQSVDSFDFEGLRKRYLDSIARIGFRETVFTDKMPLNFRWIGWILNAFPDAKIVHMVRSPMAVCWSNYQRYFRAEGLGFTFDQEDMGTYFTMYQDLMAFWHDRFPGQVFDFVYEDLTEDQEAQSRRLCTYLGLQWDDRVLAFQDNMRAVRTASSAQVREKIYKGSSEEWLNFAKMLGPMQKKLNSNGGVLTKTGLGKQD